MTYIATRARRALRFVWSCIRLRSLSLAIWLDAYDNHRTPGTK